MIERIRAMGVRLAEIRCPTLVVAAARDQLRGVDIIMPWLSSQ